MPPLTYVLVAAGLGIIYLFPLLTKAVPSPLVCILSLTALTLLLGLDVRTVARPTPFGMPLVIDRLGSSLSTESLEDRVARLLGDQP